MTLPVCRYDRYKLKQVIEQIRALDNNLEELAVEINTLRNNNSAYKIENNSEKNSETLAKRMRNYVRKLYDKTHQKNKRKRVEKSDKSTKQCVSTQCIIEAACLTNCCPCGENRGNNIDSTRKSNKNKHKKSGNYENRHNDLSKTVHRNFNRTTNKKDFLNLDKYIQVRKPQIDIEKQEEFSLDASLSVDLQLTICNNSSESSDDFGFDEERKGRESTVTKNEHEESNNSSDDSFQVAAGTSTMNYDPDSSKRLKNNSRRRKWPQIIVLNYNGNKGVKRYEHCGHIYCALSESSSSSLERSKIGSFEPSVCATNSSKIKIKPVGDK